MIQRTTASVSPAVDFVRYVRSRWRFLAVACFSAVLIAGAVSLLLPKRYTATATLVIQPPGGMDPRSVGTLSSVYLESLKTYESLFSSDTLFQQAIEQLGIAPRYPGRSIESMKRSFLRVTKPVNTRIIEVSATLEDPRKAQQLVSYIAQHGAALSKAMDKRSSSDSSVEAETGLHQAEARVKEQVARGTQVAAASDGVDSELMNLSELKLSIDRERSELRAELADAGADRARRPRLDELDRQSKELEGKTAATARRLELLRQQRENLDAELKDARAALEVTRGKLQDIRLAAGFRGERIEVVDPGIVPQRPSFPNTPLNVAAALMISLVAAFGYLALTFGLDRAREEW